MDDPSPTLPAPLDRGGLLLTAALVVLVGVVLAALDANAFWCDDFQAYHLPGFREIALALRSGELPLLSRSSWFGGALAGEYQYGLFSLPLLAIVTLAWSLPLGPAAVATVISVSHLVILATGAAALARERSLTRPLAVFVGFSVAFSGYVVVWGAAAWIPALTSFCWLPWFWRALERARAGRAGFLAPGVLLYCICAAGWPFSVLIAAAVSLVVVLRQGLARRSLAPVGFVAAVWAVGLLLSVPAWWSLLEYYGATARSLPQDRLWDTTASVGWRALTGLVLPATVSTWDWLDGNALRPNIELASGIVAPVAVAVGLFLHGRTLLQRAGWDLVLLALAMTLAMLPSPGVFRWSFRWLPLVHLGAGLVGAQAIALMAERDPRRPARLLPLAVWGALGLAWLAIASGVVAGGPEALTLTLTSGGAALAWLALSPAPRLATSGPLLVALASLVATHALLPARRFAGAWGYSAELLEAGPLERDRRYLSAYQTRDIYPIDGPRLRADFGTALRPANTAMLAGLDFVNGYSPMEPLALRQALGMTWYGQLAPQAAARLLGREAGPGGLLEVMAVDGLVVSPSLSAHVAALRQQGWSVVASFPDGTVLHRGTRSLRVRAPTLVATAPSAEALRRALRERPAEAPALVVAGDGAPRRLAAAKLTGLQEARHRVEVDVRVTAGDASALVVFARPLLPGYQATLDGREVPLVPVDGALAGVELPAGASGRLRLVYAPAGVRLGLPIALASAAALLVGSTLARRRR